MNLNNLTNNFLKIDFQKTFSPKFPKYINIEKERMHYRYPNKTLTTILPLKQFIYLKSIPLLSYMNPKNEKIYRNIKLPILTLFLNNIQNIENNKEIINKLYLLSIKLKKKIIFNYAKRKNYYQILDEKYNLFEAYGTADILIGIRNYSTYYGMETKFSYENMCEFIDEFLAGELEGNEQVIEVFVLGCRVD